MVTRVLPPVPGEIVQQLADVWVNRIMEVNKVTNRVSKVINQG